MSNFRFGLQSILELREQEQQARARALADASARAAEADGHLAMLQQIREEEAGKLLRAHSEGRSVGQLRNLSFVIERLSAKVVEAEEAAREAARRVAASRGELVEKMTERRVLDQLRERRQEEWRLGQLDLERKTMDELALRQFKRRAAGAGGGGS